MIIKSKNITYYNFVYDNNDLEEVTSNKYLGICLHHRPPVEGKKEGPL
jgi:hypothetical protein